MQSTDNYHQILSNFVASPAWPAMQGVIYDVEMGLFSQWLNGKLSEAEIRPIIRAFSLLQSRVIMLAKAVPESLSVDMSSKVDEYRAASSAEQAELQRLLSSHRKVSAR